MQITLNTAESSTDELTALIALLASLGGRLPNNATVTNKVEIRGPASVQTVPLAIIESEDDESGNFPSVEDAGRAVDSKGTPWDARIHSESKATVADGSWRKRRGVSDELFNEVMAELHAGNDDAPPPPPADEEVPLAPSDDSVPVPPAPTAETPLEPEPAASAPADGEAATDGGQFADFASFVAAVAKHGKTYAELNEMAGVVGVAAFKDLKDRADKWDMFFSMIG